MPHPMDIVKIAIMAWVGIFLINNLLGLMGLGQFTTDATAPALPTAAGMAAAPGGSATGGY